MDELVLVRHAPTEWSGSRYCGRTDLPLTMAGGAAAAEVAHDLAGLLAGEVRIVASPLLRARQTASAIAAAIGIDGFTIDDRWAETDFGVAEGLTFDELEANQPAIALRVARGDALIDWPGGETAEALRTRVEAAWRDLAGRPGTFVVVSHGGPLRLAIALATDVDPAEVVMPAPGAVWWRNVLASNRGNRPMR